MAGTRFRTLASASILDQSSRPDLTRSALTAIYPFTTPLRMCSVTRQVYPSAFMIKFCRPRSMSQLVPDGLRRRFGKGFWVYGDFRVIQVMLDKHFDSNNRKTALDVLQKELRLACERALTKVRLYPISSIPSTLEVAFYLHPDDMDSNKNALASLSKSLGSAPIYRLFSSELLQKQLMGKSSEFIERHLSKEMHEIVAVPCSITAAKLGVEIRRLIATGQDVGVNLSNSNTEPS